MFNGTFILLVIALVIIARFVLPRLLRHQFQPEEQEQYELRWHIALCRYPHEVHEFCTNPDGDLFEAPKDNRGLIVGRSFRLPK